LSDDADGYVIADAVRIVRLGPLEASGGELSASPAAALESSQASLLLEAAAARWSTAGLDAASTAALSQVQVAVTDLMGATLGVADAGSQVIWVDANAAGYGWYVDATPLADEEFKPGGDGSLVAKSGSSPEGQMDLLTVLAHELGHMLGLEDLPSETQVGDLMAETLSTGIRKVPRLLPLFEPMPAPPRAPARIVDQVLAGAESKSHDEDSGPMRAPAPRDAREARALLFADVDALIEDQDDALLDLLGVVL
jgi:hypothetical protein